MPPEAEPSGQMASFTRGTCCWAERANTRCIAFLASAGCFDIEHAACRLRFLAIETAVHVYVIAAGLVIRKFQESRERVPLVDSPGSSSR